MKVKDVYMVNVPEKNGPDSFWEIREIRKLQEVTPRGIEIMFLLNDYKDHWKVISEEEFQKLSKNKIE